MAQAVKIEDRTSIMSSPKKAYDFFKYDLKDMNKVAPQLFNSAKVVDGKAGQPGGTIQYELFVFGEKITIKLKAEKIDDAKRSITFGVVQENKNDKNTALMIKVTVNNGNITWSLQFADSKEVSEDVTNIIKGVIDLIIRALDIYLQFSF
ncbi:major latex-like protein [Striga asiatica]|uniref:Major latex-like protein n=1 Tax=Striga asiatica TaxID=4170 RepID=A0A5A7P7P6_STRAF|nr:major latex-like protein [Striga asiatica]